MNPWAISITPRALRDLEKLAGADRDAVQAGIERLAKDPAGVDIKKLTATGDEWRLRVGSWRIRFRLDKPAHAVCILRVLDRRDAYRNR